ncbi:MFS transporter [Novosphingobium sp. BL-8A]|uniref:MFS transporter n=1 Tax=Novosphingobium sp. BL-8A TaxID=3127639 RepID=UPI003757AC9C
MGLFGVQVVWGLQNVNTSRIFQSLGADLSDLPLLWIAAPITGLLVQPLVGHFSDRMAGGPWANRWGRRKPFMVAGCLLTVISLMVMGHAASLAMAIAGLWMLTASVNLLMHPLRALAADQLTADERALGFSMQVLFIGAGAVFASTLPWVLVNLFGVSGTVEHGGLPRSVELAFEISAMAVVLTVGWALLRTRETPAPLSAPLPRDARPAGERSAGLAAMGIALAIAVTAAVAPLRREAYLLAAVLGAFGILRFLRARFAARGTADRGVLAILDDIAAMPLAMRRLAVTQFLTWFALFIVWVYSVPAIALRHFGTSDPRSAAYADSADWVGVLAALYDGTAALVALGFPILARALGLRMVHALCLAIGALGIAGLLLVDGPAMLWMPAFAIGIAWASILAAPYVIVAESAPAAKVGVYMGIHNVFLVLPQLVGAACLGLVVDRLLGGRADLMLVVATVAMALAAASSLLMPRTETEEAPVTA